MTLLQFQKQTLNLKNKSDITQFNKKLEITKNHWKFWYNQGLGVRFKQSGIKFQYQYLDPNSDIWYSVKDLVEAPVDASVTLKSSDNHNTFDANLAGLIKEFAADILTLPEQDWYNKSLDSIKSKHELQKSFKMQLFKDAISELERSYKQIRYFKVIYCDVPYEPLAKICYAINRDYVLNGSGVKIKDIGWPVVFEDIVSDPKNVKCTKKFRLWIPEVPKISKRIQIKRVYDAVQHLLRINPFFWEPNKISVDDKPLQDFKKLKMKILKRMFSGKGYHKDWNKLYAAKYFDLTKEYDKRDSVSYRYRYCRLNH